MTFQSTHPRGVRPPKGGSDMATKTFQSTHPRGVRPLPPQWTRPRPPVSIHAPAWGATPSSSSARPSWACFNPRTRVGCDSKAFVRVYKRDKFQSTHPRGVRPIPIRASQAAARFQSTHPRGVRRRRRRNCRTRCGRFNPRTRVGCDAEKVGKVSTWVRVSIHAPAWGATRAAYERHEDFRVSIHAPAWGATRLLACPDRAMPGFNPRTRVGCDPKPGCGRTTVMCFNPRTRVGCDWRRPRSPVPSGPVSIHAPAWGATPRTVGSTPGHAVFQSTHPRGVRPGERGNCGGERLVSIHAPAWGATKGFISR